MAHWPWRESWSKLIARGGKSLCLAALCAGLGLALPAQAIDSVALVLSEEGQAYTELADKVRQTVAQRPGSRLQVTTFSLAAFRERQGEISRSGASLVVAVGLSATQAAAALDSRIPVLSALVPRSAFERVAREHGRAESRGFSAVYLDQPFHRQLALVRHALPERIRLGVLAGPATAEQLPLLQSAVKGTRFKLAVERVAKEDEIIPALNRLLHDSDIALFALPDPMVYNRSTIQSILLTTYRYQVPVFGFSLAYVKAGALAAVYSAPAQVGQQVGEIALSLEGDKGRGLPSSQYPKYFSVGVNYQVARSMGIEIDNEAVLYDKVRRAAEQEP